nr:protein transparent testa 9 isoform X3 [Tanacetum cinerariifolium]
MTDFFNQLMKMNGQSKSSYVEKQVMGEFVHILKVNKNVIVSVQLLQTTSIMIHNLKSDHSILSRSKQERLEELTKIFSNPMLQLNVNMKKKDGLINAKCERKTQEVSQDKRSHLEELLAKTDHKRERPEELVRFTFWLRMQFWIITIGKDPEELVWFTFWLGCSVSFGYGDYLQSGA